MNGLPGKLLAARRELVEGLPIPRNKAEGEGGCGVIGVASARPIRGKHLLTSCGRMRNRGNAKGGGVAAAGLVPGELGVSREILARDYLVQVAYLDPRSREEVERTFLDPAYEIDHRSEVPSRAGSPGAPRLAVLPPLVWRYFCRPRPATVDRFAEEHGLAASSRDRIEDELVYRTSYQLNRACYASLGEKRAFVLSHGKDLAVFKVVGYAEDAVAWYRLEDLAAHVWIGHQRYPTKGRVWHPGGAHPFVGLHEALVHNGDFANYHSIAEYLAERNIRPLFLTDTEVGVLLFDLWTRVYGYPLEHAIEALAPTTERDFELLPEERRRLYRTIQAAHIHGSPDGPWFFIVARSVPREGALELLGITDTSMLRPQVFALHGGSRPIGIVASERQAIRAFLESLAEEDPEVSPIPERTWVARGGSHTDGGAFVFRLGPPAGRETTTEGWPVRPLACTDKFGRPVATAEIERARVSLARPATLPAAPGILERLASLTRELDGRIVPAGEADHRCRARLEAEIDALLDSAPPIDGGASSPVCRIDLAGRTSLAPPASPEQALVVDAAGFPPEGPDSLSLFIARAVATGFRRVIVHRVRGQRFLGAGLGPDSDGVRIDLYGAAGDYTGSGLDGGLVAIHGDGQDQLGQILKRGRLVVYGDVGQTFLYGAKGGDIFVLGSAAGRPLICAVGKPRAVINGTCLDYLAESFMAGDALDGGGFSILNAVRIDGQGGIHDLADPYPGGNLLSLASGGAVYIRDPAKKVGEDQLNGGRTSELSDADWAVIRPYLEENERLFGVPLERLLMWDECPLAPHEVYRKVSPAPVRALEPVAFQIPAGSRRA